MSPPISHLSLTSHQMKPMIESTACNLCAHARRRCGKQRPQCTRCVSRGRTCIYPPSKPTSFVPLQTDDTPESTDLVTQSPSLAFDVTFLFDPISSFWFASAETWTIDPAPTELTTQITRFNSTEFSRILGKVFSWLSQWIETGSNPFIHRQLYLVCFPPSIQSAYTALSTYLHKSPSNTPIALRIIQENASRLVAEGLIINETPTCLDALWNLPHVQALLVYQVIGLYDGDIRLRQLTERHMPILEAWIGILMQQTSQAIYSLEGVDDATPENALWYSWIIAESVRRLWLVIAGVQGLYKLFSTPDSTQPCLGGTVFTSRQGFWEASSAGMWEKQCGERYAGLVRLTETEKLFTMVPKEEINEFAKVVLECTFGTQWCEERWVV
jgi:hypothetical protein